MFSFPVTLVVRTNESIYPLDVTIDIDKIAVVKPLLDNGGSFGVECDLEAHLVPSSEIILEDGRKLPVLETVATIFQYLDAYRELEGFFTAPPAVTRPEVVERSGVVVPLFGTKLPCDTSPGSIPA